MPITLLNNNNNMQSRYAGIFSFSANPWWLPSGILPSNVIAAYQFIKVASEADALLNQNNIATLPLTKVSATWNQSSGFLLPTTAYGPGLDNSNIKSDYSSIITIAIRFSDRAANSRRYLVTPHYTRCMAFQLVGSSSTSDYSLSSQNSDIVRRYGNATTTQGIAICEFTNNLMYLNGVSNSLTATATLQSGQTGSLIGGAYNTSSPSEMNTSTIKIQAVAFYNTALTAAQAVELSQSMAGL